MSDRDILYDRLNKNIRSLHGLNKDMAMVELAIHQKSMEALKENKIDKFLDSKEYKKNNIWNSFEATIKKWGDTIFNDSSAVDYLKKNVNKIVESFKKSAKHEDISKVLNSCEKAYNSFGSNTSKIKKQFETDITL